MRIKNWMIAVLSAALAGLAMVASILETPAEAVAAYPDLSVCVKSDGGTENIRLWEDQSGYYYVFLPGYARMDQVVLSSESGTVMIDGVPVSESRPAGEYALNRDYTIRSVDNGVESDSMLTFVRSGGVPSLYIDVASGSMEYILLDKGNKESGQIRLYDDEGNLIYDGGADTVKARGNTSLAADKKPYSFVLTENADLLGMGAARRWVLLAEGYYSCINIRNKLVYDYAQEVGMEFSPEGEFVDLYLNGEYSGLYLLSERNEIHEERVNIDPESSFLVSMEDESRLIDQKLPYVLTNAGQALRIHSASMSQTELTTRWQSVENAILAEDGIDPVSGKSWKELIDLDSWVEKYLLEEIFGNQDGGAISQFYYYDPSLDTTRIFAGPIWDYDMAMGGHDTWLRGYTDYLIMNREYKEEGMYTPWHHALYGKEEFRNRLVELYMQKFLPAMEDFLEQKFDSETGLLLQAHVQDACRWGYDWNKVSREIAYMHSFLTERLAFLSDLWINETQYHAVRVNLGGNDGYGHLAVKTGECLPELPVSENPMNLGWHIEGTDEPFDIAQPIDKDVWIYMKRADFQIPKIHYIPAAVIILMLTALIFCDRRFRKINGRKP